MEPRSRLALFEFAERIKEADQNLAFYVFIIIVTARAGRERSLNYSIYDRLSVSPDQAGKQNLSPLRVLLPNEWDEEGVCIHC